MFSNRVYLGSGAVAQSIMGGATSGDFRDSMSWGPISTYDKNVKLIAIDASRRLPAGQSSYGYGAWGSSMVAEFGGRSGLNASCRLDSDCESNLCLPSGVTSLPDGTPTAELSCASWVGKGGPCRYHKDCASGLCLYPKTPEKILTDLQVVSGISKVPLELNIGSCGSR